MIEGLSRALHPIGQRIGRLLGRGTISRVADGGNVQGLQIGLLADETRDDVMRFAEYGLTSHPKFGLPVAVLFQAGDRANGLVVAVGDHLYRPKNLPEGDVALYTDQDDGEASAEDALHRVQLTRGRKLVVRCDTLDVKCGASTLVFDANGLTIMTPQVTVTAATKVKLDTPLLEVTGRIEAGGDVKDSGGAGKTMSAMRGDYNVHVHPPGAVPPSPAM